MPRGANTQEVSISEWKQYALHKHNGGEKVYEITTTSDSLPQYTISHILEPVYNLQALIMGTCISAGGPILFCGPTWETVLSTIKAVEK